MSTDEDELFRAAECGDTALIIRLVGTSPALVHAKTEKSEETALHLAASFGHLDAVRALLDAGADINAEAHYHDTPLELALARGYHEVAELLKADKGSRQIRGHVSIAPTEGR